MGEIGKTTEDTDKEERLLKSLDQLFDWSKWMVGYEVIILGFSESAGFTSGFFFGLIVFFSLATILLAAWVMSSIASVTRRVDSEIPFTEYSIYDMEEFNTRDYATLNNLAILQHLCFAITVFLVAVALIF